MKKLSYIILFASSILCLSACTMVKARDIQDPARTVEWTSFGPSWLKPAMLEQSKKVKK